MKWRGRRLSNNIEDSTISIGSPVDLITIEFMGAAQGSLEADVFIFLDGATTKSQTMGASTLTIGLEEDQNGLSFPSTGQLATIKTVFATIPRGLKAPIFSSEDGLVKDICRSIYQNGG